MKYSGVLLMFYLAAASAFVLTAEESLAVYTRPCSLSGVWSAIDEGETVNLEVRTISGWLGFDPGVAQAANTCSFRYRWLKPVSGISADSLPLVWPPDCGVTYAMTPADTPVYPDRDTTLAPVAVISANSAAAVTELQTFWIKVDLTNSPVEQDIQGWILSESVSLNWNSDSTQSGVREDQDI